MYGLWNWPPKLPLTSTLVIFVFPLTSFVDESGWLPLRQQPLPLRPRPQQARFWDRSKVRVFDSL